MVSTEATRAVDSGPDRRTMHAYRPKKLAAGVQHRWKHQTPQTCNTEGSKLHQNEASAPILGSEGYCAALHTKTSTPAVYPTHGHNTHTQLTWNITLPYPSTSPQQRPPQKRRALSKTENCVRALRSQIHCSPSDGQSEPTKHLLHNSLHGNINLTVVQHSCMMPAQRPADCIPLAHCS